MMNRKAYKVFLVLLASVVSLSLAACGGGGGTRQPVPTSGDEMTITPPNDGTTPAPGDSANAPQNATPITSGETVEGSIDSSDDVDYFRLELAGSGTIIATITAQSGVRIAVVDANGNVLSDAVTASDATAAVTTSKGVFYLKVAYALLEERKKVSYKFVAKVIDNLETAINLVRGIPDYTINVGHVGVSIDLREYFESPEGSLPVYKTKASLGVLNLKLEGSTLDISAPSSAIPGSVITVAVSAELDNLSPILNLIPPGLLGPGGITLAILQSLKTVDIFTVTIGAPPQQIAGTDLSVSVQQGGTVMLRLTDYIEDPAGGALTFAHGSLPVGFGVTMDGADWTIATQSTVTPDDYTITVTATNAANQSEDFSLQVAVTGEGEDLSIFFIKASNVDCYVRRDNSYVAGLSAPGADYGVEILSFTYSGGCGADKTAYGQGTLAIDPQYYPNPVLGKFDKNYSYVGGWRNGAREGQGTETVYVPELDIVLWRYVGEWRNSVMEGQGTAIFRDFVNSTSTRYVGEWRSDTLWNGTITEYSGRFEREELATYTCHNGFVPGEREFGAIIGSICGPYGHPE